MQNFDVEFIFCCQCFMVDIEDAEKSRRKNAISVHFSDFFRVCNRNNHYVMETFTAQKNVAYVFATSC